MLAAQNDPLRDRSTTFKVFYYTFCCFLCPCFFRKKNQTANEEEPQDEANEEELGEGEGEGEGDGEQAAAAAGEKAPGAEQAAAEGEKKENA